MELPYSGGNDGRFPVSSPPISPCCQLKLLTCLAQANQVSFLPTKEGLLSTSTEGAYLHTYSKIRNGASSEGPHNLPRCQGTVITTKRVLSWKSPGHTPLPFAYFTYSNPSTWITTTLTGPLMTNCPLCLIFWVYHWPLICKLTISYSIKALSLASCFHSFSFIVARKKFFFRSTVILMEVFNSSSSGPKNSIKKYEVHGKILSATQLSHKAYRLQPNQSATFTRYPIILCLSRMDIFVFIPLKKAFLFLFHWKFRSSKPSCKLYFGIMNQYIS